MDCSVAVLVCWRVGYLGEWQLIRAISSLYIFLVRGSDDGPLSRRSGIKLYWSSWIQVKMDGIMDWIKRYKAASGEPGVFHPWGNEPGIGGQSWPHLTTSPTQEENETNIVRNKNIMIKAAYSLSVDFSDFLCLIHCLVCMGICFSMGKLRKPLMSQEKFPLTPTTIFSLFNFDIFTPLIGFMKHVAICSPSSAYLLAGH